MGQMMDQVDEEEVEKELRHTEAIINSMTPLERGTPSVLTGSRRARIAKGAGSNVADVNRLLKEFEAARHMMKEMMGGGFLGALTGGGGGNSAPARAAVRAHGTGKGKSKKELKKIKKRKKAAR
jgi:signal recognition particle subunit SRP54